MSFSLKQMSFKQRQFWALIILALIPIIITVFVFLPYARIFIYQQQVNELELLAELKSFEVTRQLAEHQTVAFYLADELEHIFEAHITPKHDPIQMIQEAQTNHQFNQIISTIIHDIPIIKTVAIFSQDNTPLFSLPEPIPLELDFNQYSNSIYISPIIYSKEDANLSRQIALPLSINVNEPPAILVVEITSNALRDIFGEYIRLVDNSYTYLINPNSEIIVLAGIELATLSEESLSEDVISAVLAKEDGYGLFENAHGHISLAVYRWLEEAQLGLIVETDQSKFQQQYLNIWLFIIVFEAFVFLLVYLSARKLMSELLKPLENIISLAKSLAKGKLHSRIVIDTNDEIGELAQALNKMAASIQLSQENLEDLVSERTRQLSLSKEQLEDEIKDRQAKEQALENSEKLFRKFFAALPDRTVILDSDGRYQDVLKADQHTGIELPNQVVGKTVHEVFAKEIADFFYDALQIALEINTFQVIEYTMPYPDIDSHFVKTLYLEGRIIPFTNPMSGESQVLWITRDISAQKRAEEALLRSNRSFKLLSECNRLVIHAKDEYSLYTRICHTIVELAYPAAFIAIKQDESQAKLTSIAQLGFSDQETLSVILDKYVEDHSPLDVALRAALPNIANNIRKDPRCQMWHQFSQEQALQSWIALPIVVDDTVIAVLNIFATDDNAFTIGELSFLMDMTSEIAYGIAMLRMREEQIASEANLGKYSERLQSLTQKLLLVQEQERQRISRELHDGIGQALTALKISLNITESLVSDTNPEISQRLADLVELADTTLEQVRVVAQDLRPAALDTIGLIPTLQFYCKEFERRTNLVVEFHQINPIPQVSDVESIALYRVLQEALTNVAKHAAAQHAVVTIDFDGSNILLEIADDGCGIDNYVAVQDASKGIGMLGMIERIELLDGSFDVQSIKDKGTRIILSIPHGAKT